MGKISDKMGQDGVKMRKMKDVSSVLAISGREGLKILIEQIPTYSGDGGPLGLILSILKTVHNALLRDYVTGRRIEDAYGDRPPPRVPELLDGPWEASGGVLEASGGFP